ncbi:MAG: PqqD family protein [Kiritimatiellae bacterium]|nr:PqqD family protein [Kiritimatiellia bacterium]
MSSIFSRRKTPPLDRRRSLDGVPVLNEGVSSSRGDADRVIITIRRPRRAGLMGRFQPAVIERTVKLDELGSFVFRQIDNSKNARAIIDAFVGRYQLNRREATLSTVAFLKSLVKRGVISIAVK